MRTKKQREVLPAKVDTKLQAEQLSAGNTPADLLRIAVAGGADVERLAKLMDLQERWQAAQARREFIAAMSDLQSRVPTLARRDQVDFETRTGGRTRYHFAGLGSIAEQIREPLKACGLAYRFEIAEDGDKIKVACVITHIGGHSERTEMSAQADTSGSKNAIQAKGSTVTYLQRYTLISALGITTANEDDDGRGANGGGADLVTEAQAKTIKDMIAASETDLARFLGWLGVASIEAIPAARYQDAVAQLNKKLDLKLARGGK